MYFIYSSFRIISFNLSFFLYFELLGTSSSNYSSIYSYSFFLEIIYIYKYNFLIKKIIKKEKKNFFLNINFFSYLSSFYLYE